MKKIIMSKKYNKESAEVKKAILKSIDELYDRIRLYENQGIDFNHIFNDDKVKYDKHGEFFTYKCKKANSQLRILYAYMIIDGEPVFLIADFCVKKRNNKKYIKQFDNLNDCDPRKMISSLINCA